MNDKLYEGIISSFDTTLKYSDATLQLLIALAYDARSGNNCSRDTLALILKRYDGRIPEPLLSDIVDILDVESVEAISEEVWEISSDDGSLIGSVNLASGDTSNQLLTEKLDAMQPRHRGIKPLSAIAVDSNHFELLSDKQLEKALLMEISHIESGRPMNIPKSLIAEYVGDNEKLTYFFTHLNLLVEPSYAGRIVQYLNTQGKSNNNRNILCRRKFYE